MNLNTDALLGSRPELKYQCLLALDEFPALGHMPIIDKSVGYLSGYGLRLLTVVQLRGQISKPVMGGGYGREGARLILDNHALKILYTPKELEDANEYSAILGDTTINAKSRQLREKWKGTESDQKRPLMLPQELMQMDRSKQIIHLEGNRPILCQKIRYYEETVFIDRLKSVSPTLAALGKKRPTQGELEAVWGSGELSAPIPTIDLDLHEAISRNRTRVMTRLDVTENVDLTRIALDTSALIVPDGPLDDKDVVTFVMASGTPWKRRAVLG